MADSMAPSGGQRVDAQGRVTYEFEGVVHAEGLDLESGAGFAEPFNQIRWLRDADGAVVADLYCFHDPAGDGPGAPHTANVILEALGDDNVANLELSALNETSGVLTTARFRATAIGTGAGPRRVLSVALEPELIGAPGSATILDSQGRSSFIRRADGANAGSHRGVFAVGNWPPESPKHRDRATLALSGVNPVQTVYWEFEYDANEGTANKWRFVGGPAVQEKLETGAEAPNALNQWTNTATDGPRFAVPRAGVYQAIGMVSALMGAGGGRAFVGASITAGDTDPQQGANGVLEAVDSWEHINPQAELAVAAGQHVKLRYYAQLAATRFQHRSLFVWPVAIQ